MTDDLLHRFLAFVDLTHLERMALWELIGQPLSFSVAEQIRVEGDEVSSLYFLHEGWMLSSIVHPNGSRQVLDIYRCGDIMGVPSLPFETAVASLIALTPVRVSTIPLHRIGPLFVAHPRLAAILYLNCQEERATLMDRLAVGGQLGAKHSFAALLLLLFDGRPLSDGSATRLHIPLTQSQIADVLGLSAVHISRVVTELEMEGLIRREGNRKQTYEIPDVPQLRSFVGVPARVRRRNPSWLPLASAP